MRLVDKLQIVKDKTYEKLSEGELTWRDYQKYIEERLKSLYIVSGDCETGHNWDVVFTVANNLKVKIGAEDAKGVKDHYVKLKSKPFSNKAREDVSLLNRIVRDSETYLAHHLGHKKVTEAEFEEIINNYLAENYDLGNELSLTTAYVKGRYITLFNVVDNPKKHDPEKYYLDQIVNAIINL